MSLVTIKPNIEPSAVHDYLAALDKLGLVYQFLAVHGDDSEVLLTLHADGGEAGLCITLKPDGTWGVSADIVVGADSA